MTRLVSGSFHLYNLTVHNCVFIGCYKSDKLLAPLWTLNKNEELGDAKIQGYIYSEAGAGKSKCDQVRNISTL